MIERNEHGVPLFSLYICGPMRGYVDHNRAAFNYAAEQFRALGWPVVNPVEVGEAWFNNSEKVEPRLYVRQDLLALATCCGALALLPGWEASVGARCEVAVALTLGFDFYDAETCEPIAKPRAVTITGGYEQAPGAVDTLDTLREEVVAWQRQTFTHRTLHSISTHLLREAQEIQSAPGDAEEIADAQMLVWGLADEARVDVADAVRRKLEKNKARTWGAPDADGVVEHVAEGAA